MLSKNFSKRVLEKKLTNHTQAYLSSSLNKEKKSTSTKITKFDPTFFKHGIKHSFFHPIQLSLSKPPHTNKEPDHVNKNTSYLIFASLSLVLYASMQTKANDNEPFDTDELDVLNSEEQLEVEVAFDYFVNGQEITKAIKPLLFSTNPKIRAVIEEIFFHIEAENFQYAEALADDFFINKAKKEAYYYLVKGLIFAAVSQYAFAIKYFNAALNSSDINLFILICKHKDAVLLLKKEENSLRIKKNWLKKMRKELNIVIYYVIYLISLISSIRYRKPNPYLLIHYQHKKMLSSYWETSSKENNKNNLIKSLKNQVIVRVWAPNLNEVGHVSLQTNECYLSFWPLAKLREEAINETNINYLAIIKTYFSQLITLKAPRSPQQKFTSFLEDVIAENGRLPDQRITLYSLDVNKINVFLKNFDKNGTKSWALFASSFLRRKNEYNCAIVAYEALLEGGANRIASRSFQDIIWGVKQGISIGVFSGFVAGNIASEMTGNVASDFIYNIDKSYPWMYHSITLFVAFLTGEYKPTVLSNMLKDKRGIPPECSIGILIGGILGGAAGAVSLSAWSAAVATPHSVGLFANAAKKAERSNFNLLPAPEPPTHNYS